jgi:ribosome maturation factor RimP
MEDKIYNIVESLAERLGFNLVEISLNERIKTITIFIYKKTGITIKDCEDMTNELLSEIEFRERYKDEYDIIVSSPGVNREFKYFKEYKIFEGKEVKIITDYNENPVLTGVLKGVDNENNVLIESGLKIHKIPYTHIKKGELIFEF